MLTGSELLAKVKELGDVLIECLELQCYTEKGDPDKDAGHDHMNDALAT
jgi:hypothetical protein